MEELSRIEDQIQSSLDGQTYTPPEDPLQSRLEKLIQELIQKGGGSGGGSTITVDKFLDLTSTNPVQNKIITEALNELGRDLDNSSNIPDQGIDDPNNIFDLSRTTNAELKYLIGLYRQGSSNIPDNESDWVIITFKEQSSTNIAQQIAISSGSETCKIYFRNYISGEWTDWDKFAMISDIPEESSIDVDSELSNESENPVQNKVITEELGKKAPLESPVLTGKPETPTPDMESEEDNDSQITNVGYVKEYVKKNIHDVNTNSKEKDGIVTKGSEGLSGQTWGLDKEMNPGWLFQNILGIKYDPYLNTDDAENSTIGLWTEISSNIGIPIDTPTLGILFHIVVPPAMYEFQAWKSVSADEGLWFRRKTAPRTTAKPYDNWKKITEMSDLLDYAPLDSPEFTGIPTAPTADAETNSDQIATTKFVKTVVSALINGAPETLDTLKEIADAIEENETIVDALNSSIGNKVDKVEGKGLSSNDFTNEDKEVLYTQPDWDVTSTTSSAYIQNKPDMNNLDYLPISGGDIETDGVSMKVDGFGIVGDGSQDLKDFDEVSAMNIKGDAVYYNNQDTDKRYVKADAIPVNTSTISGAVLASAEYPNRIWGTDAEGNPGWIEMLISEAGVDVEEITEGNLDNFVEDNKFKIGKFGPNSQGLPSNYQALVMSFSSTNGSYQFAIDAAQNVFTRRQYGYHDKSWLPWDQSNSIRVEKEPTPNELVYKDHVRVSQYKAETNGEDHWNAEEFPTSNFAGFIISFGNIDDGTVALQYAISDEDVNDKFYRKGTYGTEEYTWGEWQLFSSLVPINSENEAGIVAAGNEADSRNAVWGVDDEFKPVWKRLSELMLIDGTIPLYTEADRVRFIKRYRWAVGLNDDNADEKTCYVIDLGGDTEGNQINLIFDYDYELLENRGVYIRYPIKDEENDWTMSPPVKLALSSEVSEQILELAGRIAEFQNSLELKADLDSPEFTGIPTAPTADTESNNTQIATTAFVKAVVNALVNGAPETLDTLMEIADAIEENADIVTALNSAIGDKVDKIEGKGLSTNDFTNEDKNNLQKLVTSAPNIIITDVIAKGLHWDAFNSSILNSIFGNGWVTKPGIYFCRGEVSSDDTFLKSIGFTGTYSIQIIVWVNYFISIRILDSGPCPYVCSPGNVFNGTEEINLEGLFIPDAVGNTKTIGVKDSTSELVMSVIGSGFNAETIHPTARAFYGVNSMFFKDSLRIFTMVNNTRFWIVLENSGTTFTFRSGTNKDTNLGNSDYYWKNVYTLGIDIANSKTVDGYNYTTDIRMGGNYHYNDFNYSEGIEIYQHDGEEDYYHRTKLDSYGLKIGNDDTGFNNSTRIHEGGISTCNHNIQLSSMVTIGSKAYTETVELETTTVGGTFKSSRNGELGLGNSSFKWKELYAVNGTIQTSDRNEKNSFVELSKEKAEKLIYGLKPQTYMMNSGNSGRIHWGLISQDIEELLEELGWSSLDFAGFIKSPKMTEPEYDEKTGKIIKESEVVEGEYIYSLRYDEFISPIIKVEQSHNERLIELETIVEEQQNTINDLEQEINALKNKVEELLQLLS